MVSDSLVDWYLSKPLLVTEGEWPMRGVVCICNILRESGSHQRATQLAENVLIRLHSTSFPEKERAKTIEALVVLQAFLKHLPVVQFLENGDAGQRMRVLTAAAEAGLVFGTLSLDKLAQGLLHENIPKSSLVKLAQGLLHGMCTSGKECRFKNTNEMESLIESVWTEEMDESSRSKFVNEGFSLSSCVLLAFCLE